MEYPKPARFINAVARDAVEKNNYEAVVEAAVVTLREWIDDAWQREYRRIDRQELSMQGPNDES